MLGPRLAIDPSVPAPLVGLLFEAETSGGLLFSVRPEEGDRVAREFAQRGEVCAEIGRVLTDPMIRVLA